MQENKKSSQVIQTSSCEDFHSLEIKNNEMIQNFEEKFQRVADSLMFDLIQLTRNQCETYSDVSQFLRERKEEAIWENNPIKIALVNEVINYFEKEKWTSGRKNEMNIEQRIAELEARVAKLEKEAAAATTAGNKSVTNATTIKAENIDLCGASLITERTQSSGINF